MRSTQGRSTEELDRLYDALERAAVQVSPQVVPDFLGTLEQTKAILWTRLTTVRANAYKQTEAQQVRDRLLTEAEAASVLGVNLRWLHRHARQLPFAHRLSRKVLRFSEAGLRQYLAQKRTYSYQERTNVSK